MTIINTKENGYGGEKFTCTEFYTRNVDLHFECALKATSIGLYIPIDGTNLMIKNFRSG